MFSWCCCPCALAQSRSNIDGSSCLFNFFCVSAVASRYITFVHALAVHCSNYSLSRWLIRTAYDIPGDACSGEDIEGCCYLLNYSSSDCYLATFCPCCNANQLYQTTKERGVAVSDGGAIFNEGDFHTRVGAGTYKDCLYSFFCMPCAVGSMLENGMGMPWYTG